MRGQPAEAFAEVVPRGTLTGRVRRLVVAFLEYRDAVGQDVPVRVTAPVMALHCRMEKQTSTGLGQKAWTGGWTRSTWGHVVPIRATGGAPVCKKLLPTTQKNRRAGAYGATPSMVNVCGGHGDGEECLRLWPEFLFVAHHLVAFRRWFTVLGLGASHDDYEDSVLPTGPPAGSVEEVLHTACGLYLNDPAAWADMYPRRT